MVLDRFFDFVLDFQITPNELNAMAMKNKMTRKQAKMKLYSMWENGLVPSNFTEDHSEYERAVLQLMRLGYLVWEDFF